MSLSDEGSPLSEREMEIVRLLATGATNQQIAQTLIISVNTVKVHLRNIYAKLGVASRTEATMLAVREGWVDVAGSEPEEDALGDEREAPAILPVLGPRQAVSMGKRVGLALALLVALVFFLLPVMPHGQSLSGPNDPIGSVFPTVPVDVTAERWRTRAQMPTPRNGQAVVTHNDLIYAIGGVSNDGVTAKVEVYDPASDAWANRSQKPTPVGFVSAGVIGDLIYVPGGVDAQRTPLDVLEIYDPVRDVWTSGAPLPMPLAAYGLAVWGDQLYLFGGLNGRGYVASVLRYDPVADQWEELAPMDQARGFLSATALEDRIYVAGGYDDVDEYNRLDAYDPATGAWTPLAPMGLRRGGLTLIRGRDLIYAIGGGMDGNLAFNERYDRRIDAWNPIDTPVSGQWRGVGGAYVHPYVYAIGGWNEGNLPVNEAYQAFFQIQLPLGQP